jgi:hypothetical protein
MEVLLENKCNQLLLSQIIDLLQQKQTTKTYLLVQWNNSDNSSFSVFVPKHLY